MKILRNIWNFFKQNRKRILILAGIDLVFIFFLFFTAYIANPANAYRIFHQRYGYIVTILLYLIDGTTTWYILIFVVILPILRKNTKPYAWILVLCWYLVRAGNGYRAFARQQHSASIDTNALHTGVPQNSLSWFLIWTALLYFFDLIVCICAAMIIEWIRKSKAQVLLEQQKAEAELSALKYQVNPHFLFNSLSFIYNKTALLDEQAAKSVLILSDILRYNLSSGEDATGRVLLEKEVEHLENVIEMHQARHDNKLQIVFNADVTNPGVTIIPLVMIILVENAFKHGALFDRDQPVQIRLKADRQILRFSVLNKKEKGRKELSTGIGLSNMKQRLTLMYGDRCKFTIRDSEQTFFVALQIPLNT